MNKKLFTNFWFKHIVVGLFSVLLVYLFWLSRPTWSVEMRFWRAVGDGGFLLLFFTLVIGPLIRLFPKLFTRFANWRKELGIWVGLLAFFHTYLIFQGWFQWDLMRLLGYEFVPQLDRYARLEPGFGLANIVGLVALFFVGLLLATSSTKMITFLGGKSWKYLHYSAIMVYYLVVIHVSYFMFIHYTISFHRPVPPPNWFQYPFLVIALLLPLLQGIGFIKTVQKSRQGQNKV